MNHKSFRYISAAGALLFSACFVVDARAQCCGQATTAFYQPVGVQTVNTGWYPGYWWNRASARLWGSPNTYVAAYQPTYYANYGYTASYAPACSSCSSCSTCASYSPCSTCSSCSAGYAPSCSSCGTYTTSYAPACSSCASPCSSCSSCSSCGSGYVTSYAPSCGCETCGSTCPSNCGCSSCSGGQTVNQVSYQQPSGCSNCSANVSSPPPTFVAPAAGTAPQPTAAPGVIAAPPTTTDQRPTYDTNRPADSAAPDNGVQPEPASEPSQEDPYKVKKSDTSTYLEAPKLFNPKDRTARTGSIAPVRTAVYEQPVSYRHISTAPRGPISDEQARIDAIGWTSGSK